MNKKFLIPLLLVAATTVQAGTLAANSAGTSDTSFDSTDCSMVQTSFNLKLSQNVGAGWTCDTTTAVVNTGSTKGKSTYGGSTAGGTVAACGANPSTTNGYTVAAPSLTGTGCS